jgi:lipoprotein-anchoring transpeptidase ErfK/SrfK
MATVNATMASSSRSPGRLRRLRLAAFSASAGLTLTAVVVSGGATTLASTSADDSSVPAGEHSSADVGFVSDLLIAATRLGGQTFAAADAQQQAAVDSVAASPADPPAEPPADPPAPTATTEALPSPRAPLPAASGSGRRVVFDESEQRVWLVGAEGRVQATYLVSGSRHDNLEPGRYRVYSRSLHAVSYDYSSTMDYMVRFTHGDNAAIGFHDIPRDMRGRAVQSWSDLGKELSAGCIRQRPRDARALWRFAPVGTRVVVTA